MKKSGRDGMIMKGQKLKNYLLAILSYPHSKYSYYYVYSDQTELSMGLNDILWKYMEIKIIYNLQLLIMKKYSTNQMKRVL